MTQREILRTAILIGGIWVILSGISSLPSILVDFADAANRLDRDPSEQVRNLFLIYLPSGLLGVLLAAVPGIYAILASERWAARFAPESSADSEIQPSLVLAAGSMLLGLSTGLSGAISLGVSGVTFLLDSLNLPEDGFLTGIMIERALYGVFALTGGLMLFRWGSRAVRRAA